VASRAPVAAYPMDRPPPRRLQHRHGHRRLLRLGTLIFMHQLWAEVLQRVLSGEHKRAVEKGDLAPVVADGFRGDPHRHGQLDPVARLPAALDVHIAAGTSRSFERMAVDRDGCTVRGPSRNPQPHGPGRCRRCLHRNRCAVRLRKAGRLRQLDAALPPVEPGRDEQIDVERILVVKVDGIVQLGILFERGAGATPEGKLERYWI
jgi:hypothetical protein